MELGLIPYLAMTPFVYPASGQIPLTHAPDPKRVPTLLFKPRLWGIGAESRITSIDTIFYDI